MDIRLVNLTNENSRLTEKILRLEAEQKNLLSDIQKLNKECAEARKSHPELLSLTEKLKQTEQKLEKTTDDLCQAEMQIQSLFGSIRSGYVQNVETVSGNSASTLTTTWTTGEPMVTMNVNQPVSAPVTTGLSAGDFVWCKATGEGPFVLVRQVEDGVVEYANPVSGRKNSFNVGKIPVGDGWLVKCRDGTHRIQSHSTLTTESPKRTISLEGIKSVLTSNTTYSLVQLAIWISMLVLLCKQNTG